MRNILGVYKNGNYNVIMLNDGTKIRRTEADNFIPEFPECIDVKLTDKCDGGCKYCYENCTPNSPHSDILSQDWIKTVRPYTELAINGNDLTHPQLVAFLILMKKRNVIVNITVNQRHFLDKFEFIQKLSNDGLIKGIGVSLTDSSVIELFDRIKEVPNVVIHTIAGILTDKDIKALMANNAKVLILGYKIVGRGISFYESNKINITRNQMVLRANLDKMIKNCSVVSFDNLALRQLDVKNTLFKDREDWDEFYMGDDGEYTFYIDAVTKTYSKNSLESKTNRYPLKDDVVEMFKTFK